jgi:LuxR family maltose regulon positive regulatory protein
MQGLIHLQRCEWEAAVDYLGRSVAHRFIHFRRAAADTITGLLLAYQAMGRDDETQATMQVLKDYVASLDDPALWTLVRSAEARLAILEGRPEPPRRWLEATALPPEGAMLWWLDIPSVTRCRALIAEGSPGSLAEAEARLHEYVGMNEAHHNTCQLIYVLSLLALACDRQGKAGEAHAALGRAVTLARSGGFVFPFVELGAPMAELLRKLSPDENNAAHVGRILSAFRGTEETVAAGGESRVANQALLDLLTDRELEVLSLLGQRFQYKEIAARLFISPHTVNSHLKIVYRKLGVRGRRQAVARALELGLLAGPDPDGAVKG